MNSSIVKQDATEKSTAPERCSRPSSSYVGMGVCPAGTPRTRFGRARTASATRYAAARATCSRVSKIVISNDESDVRGNDHSPARRRESEPHRTVRRLDFQPTHDASGCYLSQPCLNAGGEGRNAAEDSSCQNRLKDFSTHLQPRHDRCSR